MGQPSHPHHKRDRVVTPSPEAPPALPSQLTHHGPCSCTTIYCHHLSAACPVQRQRSQSRSQKRRPNSSGLSPLGNHFPQTLWKNTRVRKAATEVLPALHHAAIPHHRGTRTCPTTSRKEKPKSTGQRPWAGHLPTSGYKSDHTGSEVLGSLRNSPQAGMIKATTQALTVIFQVCFVNIIWHFGLHDVQLQNKGEGGYLLTSTSYNGNLSRRCLAQIIGI